MNIYDRFQYRTFEALVKANDGDKAETIINDALERVGAKNDNEKRILWNVPRGDSRRVVFVLCTQLICELDTVMERNGSIDRISEVTVKVDHRF